jgi:hypothetical protein
LWNDLVEFESGDWFLKNKLDEIPNKQCI